MTPDGLLTPDARPPRDTRAESVAPCLLDGNLFGTVLLALCLVRARLGKALQIQVDGLFLGGDSMSVKTDLVMSVWSGPSDVNETLGASRA